MIIKLSKSSYSLKSVKDAIYWLSAEYGIILDQNKTHFLVNCDDDSREFKKRFLMLVNDYSLRDLIHQETKEIKDLDTAKAFYPELVKFKPVGEFDDPVNFEKKNGTPK